MMKNPDFELDDIVVLRLDGGNVSSTVSRRFYDPDQDRWFYGLKHIKNPYDSRYGLFEAISLSKEGDGWQL